MAEQTSAERFEKWWRRQAPTYREWGSGQGLSRNDARKVWDAATAATEEQLDDVLGGLQAVRATYHPLVRVRGLVADRERLAAEVSALRQRIAELEGR